MKMMNTNEEAKENNEKEGKKENKNMSRVQVFSFIASIIVIGENAINETPWLSPRRSAMQQAPVMNSPRKAKERELIVYRFYREMGGADRKIHRHKTGEKEE